ncbi:MAG: phosphoribosylglycinamide formyltransferase [Desulfovibrionaceae bacterium]|nr:phosphoribosylglycinamide formyltransferase [Desulfovibrionaceae bacterium]
MTLPIAVLISGGGSNLQSIMDRIGQGVLDAEVRVVLSDRPEAFGLERARARGVATAVVRREEFPDRLDFDREMIEIIRSSGAQAVCLAGFMRLVTPDFLHAFPDRVLNIHPALLPSFPGVHGQSDAAGYGVKLSGCTVHFVDEQMDHGPIIIQAAVPAYPGEGGAKLGERILRLEHRIYPQAVGWLAQGRLGLDGRQVRLAPSGAARAVLDQDPPCLVNPPLEQGF